MRYRFIEGHRAAYRLTCLCAALAVSRSGYYAWLMRPESGRARRDRELLTAIQRVHTQTRARYGAIKTWRALTAAGMLCGRERVARLRRQHGIVAQRTRRFRVMTEHHQWTPPAPNRLTPRCYPTQRNRVWAGDLTAIPTRAGWLHLAVVLDLCSRRVVGWAMSATADRITVMHALRMALEQRQPRAGVVHHTDQGAQYTSPLYRTLLTQHGLVPSMSRKGNCYDNAVVESFFSTLKNELVHDRRYLTRDEARAEIFEFIEVFYNRQRLHQSLDYVSPAEFEVRQRVP
jgi:putative transposase